MAALGSTYLDDKRSNRTWIALVLVALLHLAIFWALQNGLAQKTFTVVKKAVEAKLIEEVKPKLEQPPPPPPAPPAPKIEKALPPPAQKSIVPIPEVRPPPTAVPAITAAPEPPAPPTPTAPVPTPTPVAAPPAPVAAPPTPAPPNSAVTAPLKTGIKTGAKDVSGSCEPPDYPSISRRNEEEGTVVVAFLIAEDGRVVNSKIKSSSGFNRLDEAARAAFSKCKFRPATSDGQPVQGEATVAYRFRLD